MRRVLISLAFAAAIAGAAFLWLTRPAAFDAAPYVALQGDAVAGQQVFAAAGCGSCHAAETEDETAPPVLSGGYRMKSPFGTFVAPNISPGPQGIGGWSQDDFARALKTGVSPSGQHYYPSFPYSAYQHMAAQDIVDLWAFMQTLPVSDAASAHHELPFPVTIRRGLGVWKLMLAKDFALATVETPEVERGRYLVEALGHCAECHTPRGLHGHLDRDQWMKGAPNPSGKGRIPAIDPTSMDWSVTDIAYYLETGFTPEYDSVGGQMADVVTNLSKLPPEDRAAIAAYLKALR